LVDFRPFGVILMFLYGGKLMAQLSKNQAWTLIGGAPWLGGTPGSDNGDLSDLVNINRGKAYGGDDHLRGNENDNALEGGGGNDFLRGAEGNDYLFGDAGQRHPARR
jgi:Ca2+-binding RTX toxin-like protein